MFFCLALSSVADTHGSDCCHHGTRKKSGQIRARIHTKKLTHKTINTNTGNNKRTKNEKQKKDYQVKRRERNTKKQWGGGGIRTGFAAESGQIRKNWSFSKLRGLNLCTSHILVFGCLHGQDVDGSLKKVAEKNHGTKITQYYVRCHLYRVISSWRHLCPKPPKIFERKLHLVLLKEQLIKI